MTEIATPIHYPQDLPVVAAREEILAALRDHQVIVVCGETGSGKTTQLPKLCLEWLREAQGEAHRLVGHTQPRRIAARTVAARIAEEMKTTVGGLVGYKVRFSDHVGPDCRIKLMTDGILLAETASDPLLRAYDALIIDEAHERSLNIDFLLGYLRRLLPRRPGLRIVITSATLDPERIAAHFADAPVIRVEGRSHPIEIRYRPLAGEDEDARDLSLLDGLCTAVDECARHGAGDVLVFVPGEREIREAAEALRKHHPPQTEILPLYARLSAAEQNRVFKPHGGRRIVLATNVAETALTVPGIRYVVDTGLVRVMRYSPRSRMQRLVLEPVSQASASQRAGRCGRLGPGLCIRLYGEDDFALRPPFTDPEILRSNLASVILRMADAGLGDPQDFPFIDAPDPRAVRDAYRLLAELRGVDERHGITASGRALARLPVDPRLAAVLLAAERGDCIDDALIVVSFFAIQDPRERPADRQAAADQAHAVWRHRDSDFLAALALWDGWHEQSRHLSRSKLRGWCAERFVSHVRMREWHELHGQLKGFAADKRHRGETPLPQKTVAPRHLGEDAPPTGSSMRVGGPSPARLGLDRRHRGETPLPQKTVAPMGAPLTPDRIAAIHRALLAGFASQIGMLTEKGDYLGANGRRFRIHPGSGLARKPPKWIVAAEIVETTRVFARGCAHIDPQWIGQAVPHLLKHHHFEPHFEERTGKVGAFDRVTLFGLVVDPRAKVDYARIDAREARRIFIREGLVAGRLRTRGEFLPHNRALVEEVEDIEARARRRDLLADEETMYAFYDARVPPEVCDGPGFERWRKVAERGDPRRLFFDRDALLQRDIEGDADRFPDDLDWNGLRLPLTYRFEPGAADDGVTVTVPLAALNAHDPARAGWLVPGLIEERITALIKSMPKALRRHFVPAPDFARAALERMRYGEGTLADALARALEGITGISVPPDAWRPETIEPHLCLLFRIVDEEGTEIAGGRDLAAIKAQLSGQARESFAQARPAAFGREGITDWDFGGLPAEIAFVRDGVSMRGFPALDDRRDSVALVLHDTPAAAMAAHRAGLRRLFMLHLHDTVKYLYRNLPDIQRMCLQYAAVDRCEALKDDLVFATVERVFMQTSPPTDHEAFAQRIEDGRGEVMAACNALCGLAAAILSIHHRLRGRLKGNIPTARIEAVRDIDDQVRALVHPHFLLETPAERLAHFPRYLAAAERRLDRLEREPEKDRRPHMEIAPLWQAAKDRLAARPHDPQAQHVRWLVEELRVSLFAQELGTAEKVSVKRITEMLRDKIR